ncbi:MAG: preprotein translocase subunit SecA [Myxococcales bacterium]|nr:preprotein translocase subunit SecA [Myxococcales bacterium]
MSIISKIFGSKNDRELKKLNPLVSHIASFGDAMEARSDDELKALTPMFKEKLDNGASLDDILPEAFAMTREVAWRVMQMRHYDVQMVGGIFLHRGVIAEMRTGEGKTLTATSPVYLNALEGRGVHVVTVNDYLAARDAEWMGQIYKWMGLSVGVIVHGIDEQERQAAYQADVTYGQNSEFGFDYLRDNMKMSPDKMAQRGLRYAVIDEVDSILIDEARTPLIISGPAEQSAQSYEKVDKIVPRLKRDIDYTVDEKAHSAMLTDSGVETVQELLELENLYDPNNIQLNHHVGQALRAHTLYKRDVNYLIDEGKVVIIDDNTGRKMEGRRWSDGLHQAIEAKEGVTIEEENQTLATVTYQNFFRMYDKLSGMTGTADTEAAEFHHIYKLEVLVIPTNKPLVRDDQRDLIYKNEKGKFKAVFKDITKCHEKGQPVLVGTTSVEKSEVIATLLRKQEIPFEVLNAKQHEREALVVAQAGRKGSITISTNMAGRGTDIVLGGNAEVLAEQALKDEGEEGNEERLAELIEQYETECTAEREEVLDAGGLRVIGTERHESRRIDNQLRGRAGRQGDVGASRFYLSLEDDLLRIFMGEKVAAMMERLGFEEDIPIESGMVTKSIENAQKKVEGHNFDQRKSVLEYDDVMNQQRKTIYGLRNQVLRGQYIPNSTDDDGNPLPEEEIEEPPTVSGEWTIEGLSKDLHDEIAKMVNGALAKKNERAELKENNPYADIPEIWYLMRSELWRQTGTWIGELEKQYDRLEKDKIDKEELLAWVIDLVARSLIQQRERLFDLSDTLIGAIVEDQCPADSHIDDWDFNALNEALSSQFNVKIEIERKNVDQQVIAESAWAQVETQLESRMKELGRPWLMYFARHFYLKETDSQWIEHLKNMDTLREGIGLRSYGQKDPKKEYKREGFELFSLMMTNIQHNTGENIFRVQIRQEEEVIPSLQQSQSRETHENHAGDDDYDPEQDEEASAQSAEPAPVRQIRRDRPKIGRNDPCHCGSGKKYKKCHGREGSSASL